MLSYLFRASRKRDLLIGEFFDSLRSQLEPREIVESFSPLLQASASAPRDQYYADAIQSGFSLLQTRLSQKDFMMVALHVMGRTNLGAYNSRAARDIAFGYIEDQFHNTLTDDTKRDSDSHAVGLIFAARSVVLSSLSAGNIAEARLIVADLQDAIEAFRQDEMTVPVVTIQQTLREIGQIAAHHELALN